MQTRQDVRSDKDPPGEQGQDLFLSGAVLAAMGAYRADAGGAVGGVGRQPGAARIGPTRSRTGPFERWTSQVVPGVYVVAV